MTLTPEEQVLMAVHSGLSHFSDIVRHVKTHTSQIQRCLDRLVYEGSLKFVDGYGWAVSSIGYTRVQALQEGGIE